MREPQRPKACAKCRANNGKLYPCEGGYICDPCLQRHRKGTDTATRVARACQGSMTAQAEANRLQKRGEKEATTQYQLRADQDAQEAIDPLPASPKVEVALGEVVPADRLDIRDTLTAPDAAALDASARRIDLLARMGTDSVALGVDAAQSIGAQDEPEEHAPFAKDDL